jgi:hypothetical protein
MSGVGEAAIPAASEGAGERSEPLSYGAGVSPVSQRAREGACGGGGARLPVDVWAADTALPACLKAARPGSPCQA